MDQQVESTSNLTLAVLRGTPLIGYPEDLYIPPDALRIFLETFEGPLDLLLYLIRRQNIDILDIPVAEITRQYVKYIEMMQSLKMELAADYLVMGAILAEIKSRVLLPRPENSAHENEEDPRSALMRRLQEYERFKSAAIDLDELPRMERDHFEVNVDTSTVEIAKKYPDVDLSDLLSNFREVLRRMDMQTHHTIQREPLSVRERMNQILHYLREQAAVSFSELFNPHEGRAGAIVSFLAILELSKQGLVELWQMEPTARLTIQLASMP